MLLSGKGSAPKRNISLSRHLLREGLIGEQEIKQALTEVASFVKNGGTLPNIYIYFKLVNMLILMYSTT